MKYLIQSGFGLVLAWFLYPACNPVSCPKTKKELISRFNQFVGSTVRDKEFYSIREWEAKDKEFSGYLQDCYPILDTTFYLDDKQRFWSDALRYYFKRYDNRVTTELLNNKNPNSVMLQTQIRSIWANPDEAFTRIFQEMTGLKFDDALKAARDSIAAEDQ